MPLMNDCIRAMLVLENTSALPEDRVVNTFHFFHDNIDDAGHTAAQDRVIEFINAPQTGGNPLCYYLSQHLDRGTNKAQVRTYDLGTAEPRLAHVRTFTLGAASNSGTQLPNEVAITCSFYAGRNIGRKRGRIYLGPLNGSALEDSGGDARVTPQCRTDLCNSMARMAAAGPLTKWSVYSRADAQLWTPVSGGWVDNAFDTQRRRGRKATSRTPWGA